MLRITIHGALATLTASLALGALSGCVFQVGDAVVTERARDEARVDLPGGGPSDVGEDPSSPSDPADPATNDPNDPSDPGEPAAPLPPWDSTQPFTGARDGRIVGTIGPAVGLNLPTDIAHVYDDGYYTQIEVFALRSDGRRVMLALQIQTDGEDGPFFVPGVGKRMKLGYTTAGYVGALACEGPDSGDPSEPFGDTPFDEEPCEVGVDTEQDPENPANVLRVTVQAVFADADGDCPEDPGAGVGDGDFGEEDLPDMDGDGDGDLCDDDDEPTDPSDPSDPSDPTDPGNPPPSEPTDPNDPGSGGGVNPLTATATFSMTR
jgi:hypothetical protein